MAQLLASLHIHQFSFHNRMAPLLATGPAPVQCTGLASTLWTGRIMPRGTIRPVHASPGTGLEPDPLATKPVISTEVLPVFMRGKYDPTCISVHSSPKPLLIYAPSEQGTYPVILFFHGYYLHNYFYSDLLQHIASHGFIVVAPQLYPILELPKICPPSESKEIKSAAKVADWLASSLQSVLPRNVDANLGKFALVGHSRGGKTAFALALGRTNTTKTFHALVGIDPVDTTSKHSRGDPKVLTYVPFFFDLSIPVNVIGTGLGPECKCGIIPPCAPEGMNHEEFFRECKPPRAHFVAQNYGHMDVLDDHDQLRIVGKAADCLCVGGKDRDPMRRCVGGIVVAFLNYYFKGEKGDFMTIVKKYKEPHVSPVKLDEVTFND